MTLILAETDCYDSSISAHQQDSHQNTHRPHKQPSVNDLGVENNQDYYDFINGGTLRPKSRSISTVRRR